MQGYEYEKNISVFVSSKLVNFKQIGEVIPETTGNISQYLNRKRTELTKSS